MARLTCLLLSAVVLFSATVNAWQAPKDTLLDYDDFSRYDPGKFGEHLNPGFPEYHHVDREYMGGWAVVNNRGPDEWKIFRTGDEKSLDFMGYNSTEWTHRYIYPMLVRGHRDWRDYTVRARVTPYSRDDYNGVVFRYQDGRHYYLFAFGPGDSLTLRYRDGEKGFRRDGWHVLAEKQFATEPLRVYELKVEAVGNRIRCSIDGREVISVTDGRYDSGKVGVFATCPVRFHEITVTATEKAKAGFVALREKKEAEIEALRRANPQPVLWKRIRIEGFGAARALRLGDLTGDGRLDLLLVQNIPFFGGNYNRISCMTALDLDGNLLWQVGTPDPKHAWLSYDPAVQIHDIDDDGKKEVIYAEGEWIKVLEGATGREKARYPVPESRILPDEDSWLKYRHYYRRDLLPFLNVDCFAFADLRGLGKPLDVIVKDRHTRLWAYTNEFKLLWTATANLGHFPYIYDYDRDGRDDIFLGYTLFGSDGKIVWTLDDKLQEHADGMIVADLSLSGKPDKVFIAGSDDGVAIADIEGNILKHHRVGHAQTPTAGKFRPDIPGLQFCNINFWGEPGLITLYDSNGDEIINFEPFHAGSPVMPVNWTGDGTEYILLSTSPKEGGMLDGWGRRVVMFPDDGHPDLAYFVHDLTGDPRDEIITWDPDWLYIYTQSDVFSGDSIYAPKRPPTYNESNYLPVLSWPVWRKVTRD